MAVDFEAEGLLNGLRGRARQARSRLLEELAADGVPFAELGRAVAEDRLVLLPVERALAPGGERYTAAQVAERSGVDRELLDRRWQALGLAIPAENEAVFTDEDLESARRVQAMRDAGVPDEGIIELDRVMGVAMSQVTDASRRLVGEAFLRRGDTEQEAGLRLAEAARNLAPTIGPTLQYVFNVHLREQLRSDAIYREELTTGRLAGAREVTVCFADLVGFTRLGDTLPTEELGGVTSRLWELAGEVVRPPVRLVKMIGDAAMLVAPDTESILDAALALVAAIDSEEESFPRLRAGVARGPALPRGGDWYGRPVNLASRVTGIARPGSVLVSAEAREAARAGYRWSGAGTRRLKGIEKPVRVYRCRALAPEGDGRP